VTSGGSLGRAVARATFATAPLSFGHLALVATHEVTGQAPDDGEDHERQHDKERDGGVRRGEHSR
jgi:hypothetical protein